MDWLTGITQWLLEMIVNFWTSFIAFVNDIWVIIAETVLSAISTTIHSIPSPAFLDSYSMGNLLNNFPSDVLYFLSFLQLPAGFSLIAAGVAFRMTRKLITLFQW